MWKASLVLLCTFLCACSAYPFHASCKIDWTFGLSCDECSKKIINQMNTWKGADCGSSERCKYKVTSFVDGTLKGTHTTPKKDYVDDLMFQFTSAGSGCKVHGESRSETWYAVLDYGTNYCNLHNLITGSGLDQDPSYKEMTSNSECTQFSSADCDTY